ncbi:MAG TPA: diguanylate cyclase [Xanthomonadaceae bacterium]|nr:diguanylate cyclase [Xanthomonadaceae bacterium]
MSGPLPSKPARPIQAESERRLTRLPWRAYRLRVLGMGLAALPMSAVLFELDSPWPVWVWAVATSFLWPHVAFLVAARSRDPFRAELRNFMLDSFLAGSWVPLMHFNLLPSAVLLTVATADKINSGVRGLWLRSLPGMVLAIILAGIFTGFAVQYPSSTLVILACLPIMVIHTLTVSASTYRLVRKLQRQNLELDQLSRFDALTGLESRGAWQAYAEAVLERHQQQGVHATLLLLDLDYLKDINDRHGHIAGDDVLRGIANRIRQHLGNAGHAGRIGGDEFAVILPMGSSGAEAFAESLRADIESLNFPGVPGLRCSVSLGLAAPPDAGLGLREWVEAADRALYRAKQGGRNRTVGRERVPGDRA